MEIKMFYTLIKKDGTIGKNRVPINDYATGVIYGLMIACSEENKRYTGRYVDEGTVFRMVGTEAQYTDFKKMVKKIYPDACIFNYEM